MKKTTKGHRATAARKARQAERAKKAVALLRAHTASIPQSEFDKFIGASPVQSAVNNYVRQRGGYANLTRGDMNQLALLLTADGDPAQPALRPRQKGLPPP